MIETLRFGGAERLCVDICSRLDRRRFMPYLFTYWAGENLAPVIESAGVPWRRCVRRRRWDVGHITALLKWIDEEEIQLLHSHLYGGNVWGEITSWLRRSMVHLSHVHLMDFSRASLRSLVTQHIIGRSDRVIAVCESDRRQLIHTHGLPADKVVTVYNGVDLERFKPASEADKQAGRARLGVPNDRPVIGIVASLGPRKHHENLFAAVQEIASACPVSIVIVGTGSQQRILELQGVARNLGLGDRVYFLGPRTDVWNVLPALDVGVLCSRMEAMPIAVLEYMAAGLPAVCTDVGGVAEVLAAPSAGMLVPKENSWALAEALKRILTDDDLRRRLGEQARRRAEEKFDLSRTVRQIETLYLELLEHRRPRWF